VNVPARGIGAVSLEKFLIWQADSGFDIITALSNVEQTSALTPRAKQALARLGDVLRQLQVLVQAEANPSEIIEQLLKATGYRDYILDGTPQAEERDANVGVLIGDAKTFVSLPDFLEEVALMSSADVENKEKSVTLMTLHAAKGLEFPVVFMVGLEEGVLPSARALEEGPRQLEEERRLCYVGMTRAREELHLLYAMSRQQYGVRDYAMPSRFLQDMGHVIVERPAAPAVQRNEFDEVVMEYDIGDTVRSLQFGVGEVIDIDGLAVTVRFTSGMTKKLNVEYARLERADS